MLSCDRTEPILRAYQADSPNQLIGGDVAMARVGDFILENDQIRIAILGDQSSPGPGVFGGTMVDADLQRGDARFRNGNGHDQLAEVFPFANLLAPRPGEGDIEVIADGSNGQQAIVRVSGEGGFILDALKLFNELAEPPPDTDPLVAGILASNFPDLKFQLRIETDYILEPGDKFVRMVSRISRIEPDTRCADDFACAEVCEGGYQFDSGGCPICACAPSTPTKLESFTEQKSLFEGALGNPTDALHPGVIGGDFVFFGAQNNLFAPGMGFDEDTPVFEALFEGRDSFNNPLAFEFMAGAGGNVSYGYFSVDASGELNKVLVPIITSSTTAFTTAQHQCPATVDESAEALACRAVRSWSFERYFAIGDGDVGSVVDIMNAVRGVEVGVLHGTAFHDSMEPAKNARIFVFRDPDEAKDFSSVNAVLEANWKVFGEPGVLNAIDADVGLDKVEDGRFSATLRPGQYLVAATNQALTATSPVTRVQIVAGQRHRYQPLIPAPATVRYEVVDEQGRRIEAKLNFIPVIDGRPAQGDGLRRPAMGEGRIGNGIRHQFITVAGEGVVEVEAGEYIVQASHGPTHGRAQESLVATSGEESVVHLVVPREVDTTGWISLDSHLHAEPSFDSGVKLDKRVGSVVAEGVDFAIATDHDVVTDYQPWINRLGLNDRLGTAPGVELSTLESGHFIAFPLRYDALDIPAHGSPDWACQNGQSILDRLSDLFEEGKDGVRLLAHPRDGFTGYISQLGVNPFDLSRKDLARPKLEVDLAALTGNSDSEAQLLEYEGNNPLFRQASCDFDGIEVFTSKRFDLIRTPTNEETVLFNRCMLTIRDLSEGDIAGLESACPEFSEVLATVAPCTEEERFFDCKMRVRQAVSNESIRNILYRSVEEQERLWGHQSDPSRDRERCEWASNDEPIDPSVASMPCVEFPGMADDWMRWLDFGFHVTATGASDSHGTAKAPGTPRAWLPIASDSNSDLDGDKIAEVFKRGELVASYGPFVEVSIEGRGPGELVSTSAGETITLQLRVQTPSWFGVDRIEVYVSGRLERELTLEHGPEVIIDYEGELTVTAPDRDGFVTVIAMGLDERNLFGPTVLDVPFGELQLPRIALLAFGALPGIGALLPPVTILPDFHSVFPMALTNAIRLDVDGDGVWHDGAERPPFCSVPCDPSSDGSECPDGQVCLAAEGVCGFDIEGDCETGVPGLGYSAKGLIE